MPINAKRSYASKVSGSTARRRCRVTISVLGHINSYSVNDNYSFYVYSHFTDEKTGPDRRNKLLKGHSQRGAGLQFHHRTKPAFLGNHALVLCV